MADPTCAHCGADVMKSNWPDCCKGSTPAAEDELLGDPGHVHEYGPWEEGVNRQWRHCACGAAEGRTREQPVTTVNPGEALFVAPYGVKMLRETLTTVEKLLQRHEPMAANHLMTVAFLIRQCDAHRPLGSDGKHGDQHTATCGCDEPRQLRLPHPHQHGLCGCGHLGMAHEWTPVDDRCNLCACDGWSAPR